jgi:sulfatase modifying factor 1
MEFVHVSAGCFQMGDSANEGGKDEKPVHEVCIDDFYIGKYEVTQGQWQKIMGNNPAKLIQGDDYPVDSVSWMETNTFMKKLNILNKKLQFRLPTEAEWEYAARAGTTTPRYWGNNPAKACAYANVHDTTSKKRNEITWPEHNCDDGFAKTAPVGSFKPNNFNLYDMMGNVWEWCADRFDKKYYEESPRNNPLNSSTGPGFVMRGGAWDSHPPHVRSARRFWDAPGGKHLFSGFRLVAQPQGSEEAQE